MEDSASTITHSAIVCLDARQGGTDCCLPFLLLNLCGPVWTSPFFLRRSGPPCHHTLRNLLVRPFLCWEGSHQYSPSFYGLGLLPVPGLLTVLGLTFESLTCETPSLPVSCCTSNNDCCILSLPTRDVLALSFSPGPTCLWTALECRSCSCGPASCFLSDTGVVPSASLFLPTLNA